MKVSINRDNQDSLALQSNGIDVRTLWPCTLTHVLCFAMVCMYGVRGTHQRQQQWQKRANVPDICRKDVLNTTKLGQKMANFLQDRFLVLLEGIIN